MSFATLPRPHVDCAAAWDTQPGGEGSGGEVQLPWAGDRLGLGRTAGASRAHGPFQRV